MVRPMQKTDLDRVAELWLETNLRAHDFISPQYWQSHAGLVKTLLSQAEVYVYAQGSAIHGFIGLEGTSVEGLFVSGPRQSQGIGRQLLDTAKAKKARLRLMVYRKNEGAVRFYLREGFSVQRLGRDGSTGEAEYAMTWRRA